MSTEPEHESAPPGELSGEPAAVTEVKVTTAKASTPPPYEEEEEAAAAESAAAAPPAKEAPAAAQTETPRLSKEDTHRLVGELRAEIAARHGVSLARVRMLVNGEEMDDSYPAEHYLRRYFGEGATEREVDIIVTPEDGSSGAEGSAPPAPEPAPEPEADAAPEAEAAAPEPEREPERATAPEPEPEPQPVEADVASEAVPEAAAPGPPVEGAPDNGVRVEAPPADDDAETFEMEVRVRHDDEDEEAAGAGESVVRVQVVREGSAKTKRFSGGYRNTLTGAEYHHADVQTNALTYGSGGVQKVTREAQTVEVLTRSQQTARESATQMERRDLATDNSGDREVESRPYQTAEEFHRVLDESTVRVQCFIRSCFAWRRVRRLEVDRQRRAAEAREARAEEERRAEEAFRGDLERRAKPRTQRDFELLRREVDEWRLAETERIKSQQLPRGEVKRQLEELLHKEVRLMQSLDRMRIEARRRNREEQTKRVLEMMATPKEWDTSAAAKQVEVETPLTMRARELVELYHGLCLPGLPRQERLDVLFNVQWVVKDFDCNLTRDILQLLERELDLLNRGRSGRSLEGLRKRLASLFLRFASTAEFNPEAGNFQRAASRAASSRHE